jgi:hypothetical protein
VIPDQREDAAAFVHDRHAVMTGRADVPVVHPVASQSFDSRVTAGADSLPEIIAAFDEAAGKVLRRLVAWTLTEGDQADRALRRTS